MSITLRSHQEKAVNEALPILREKGVVYLALEMRTGKTLAALKLAHLVSDMAPVLFITPKAAISSVLADSSHMPELDGRLTVINPESLHKLNMDELQGAVLVLDENHRRGSFPKVSKATGQIREIVLKCGVRHCILLSGTPSVESAAQLFHQFWCTTRGPWKVFNSKRGFYNWHREYGIPKTVRIAGGQEAKVYDEVRSEVLNHVAPYVVTMKQEEAGFKFAPEVIPVMIDNPDILEWSKKFGRDGIAEVDGHTVLGETPAAKLQKMHMAEGGTLIDDKEEAFVHKISLTHKYKALGENMCLNQSYFVTTAYIKEREVLYYFLSGMGFRVYGDFEDFEKEVRAGGAGVFIGSGIKYAEGVDLSWLTGSQIIYSLNWSGAKYLQLIQRQNNFKRDRPIKVHVLLTRGGVDEMVFKAVSSKANFNATVYKAMK